MSEQDVAAEVTALADQNRAAGSRQLSRRGLLQPLCSRGCSLGDLARRIRDQLHALPGRGEPGHHAGDFRISDAHHPADRPRGRQRQYVRRRFRRGRGGVDGAAHRAQALDRRALARALAGLSRDDSDLPERSAAASRSSRFRSTQRAGKSISCELGTLAKENLLCVVAGYPNGFGIIEPLGEIAKIAHQAGALAISVTAEGLALGLLKAPGDLGIDIAVGEGQSFGLPLQFGGPGLGFMAARNAHLRQMPGRLVGQTRDADGNRAFTLTLATREQHIRRERATSNICTNHSLCALAATVYLSLLGRRGLRELAERNVELAHQAHDVLAAANIQPRFSGPFFNEFVMKIPRVASALKSAEDQWHPRGTADGAGLSRTR